MLYSVSRRPAMDNPRLVRITVGCGMALSVIGLTSYLAYGFTLGLASYVVFLVWVAAPGSFSPTLQGLDRPAIDSRSSVESPQPISDCWRNRTMPTTPRCWRRMAKPCSRICSRVIACGFRTISPPRTKPTDSPRGLAVALCGVWRDGARDHLW